ncbi:MAG: hypothetical protein JWM63_4470 [Gammaproteobacteria bacterium]|jgi:aspartate 1-decarboxylase|nr:hypothetical protein [Gammaproteobacteria bacterium]
MLKTLLQAKLQRVNVACAELHYEGSRSMDDIYNIKRRTDVPSPPASHVSI